MKQKILLLYYTLLGRIAHTYLKKHKPTIIGINGSVGKTSCRMIINQTLQQFFPHLSISTSAKNFNGELGLSLSIFEIDQWNPHFRTFIKTLCIVLKKYFLDKKPYDIIILEYGIDRPKEMEFLLNIAKPHIGIFTAIDCVHSEQFGNPNEIAKEEVKMIQNTRDIAFLNENDTYALQLKNQLGIDTITYQTEGHQSKADIQISNIDLHVKQGKLPIQAAVTLAIKGKPISFHTNLFGKANYGYIGVALAICDIIAHKFAHHKKQQSPLVTKDIILHYHLQPGRFSIFEGIEGSILFDSSYNASPLSMRNIINTVWTIKQDLFSQRPLWLVLGDMRELGDLTETEHRKLAGYVSQVADRVFLIGDHMTTHMADELEKIGYSPSNIYKFHLSHEAGEIIKRMIIDQNTDKLESPLIIFKGSQNTIFLEEAVKLLLKKSSDVSLLTRQSDWWLKKKGL